MTKSATDVMQEVIFAAVLDAVEALKKASKGVPNNLLRDLNALHVNTAMADTSPELQAAIQASIRSSFTRLQREGYSVTPAAPQRPTFQRPLPTDGRPARPPAGGNRPGPREPRRDPTGRPGPRPGGNAGPRGGKPRG